MRSKPGLGAVNLALVSLYFAPVWGREGLRGLLSPYHGFEQPAHAAAAAYVREFLDLGLNGLLRTSHVLAGIKLVVAAGFAAYLIEFCRSLLVGRDVNRETLNTVLVLAAAGIAVFALPALALGDPALVRLNATQLLLIAGCLVVTTIERQIVLESEPLPARVATAERERAAVRRSITAITAPRDRRFDLPWPRPSSPRG